MNQLMLVTALVLGFLYMVEMENVFLTNLVCAILIHV